jgi:hypothetical protein
MQTCRSMYLLFVALCCACLLPRPVHSDAPSAGEDHAIHIPFEFYGNHLYVPLRVKGGKDAWFLLDSAAGVTVMDTAYAQRSGVHTEGSREVGTAGGTVSMSMAKDLRFELSGLEVPVDSVAVMSLDGLIAASGREVDGVLSVRALSGYIVKIDYAAKVVTLYDPATFHYSGNGATLPFTVSHESGSPIVDGTLFIPGRGPIEIRCAIDAGAKESVLTSPFVDAKGIIQAAGKTVHKPGFGIDAGFDTLQSRLSGLKLGPYLLTDPVIDLFRAKQGALASSSIDANIGNDILGRFTMIIDYGHQQLILEPNAGLSKPFHADASGLSLVAKGSDLRTFEIIGIAADSPATEAGLQNGDIIETIDGQPATKFRSADIKDMFLDDGRTYRLKIRRGDVHLDIELKLRKLI